MKLSQKLLISGAIVLSSLSLIKKVQGQVIDGWFEESKGIKQGPNLRLYPTLNIKGIKLSSLIDINNFYSFTKTDLSYDKLALKLGEHAVLNPLVNFHTNLYNKKITAGANVTAFTDKYFGFVQVYTNPADIKNPEFYTYHDFATKIGNFGFFAFGPLKDIKSTYAEFGFTAKDIKDCGISPYARVNLMKGVKPTYQVGASINPRKLIKKFKKNKK